MEEKLEMVDAGLLTPTGLAAQVAAHAWYHKIPLPYGIVTPGFVPLSVEAYRIPENLAGKRVLDVGTWDGYWTFEALKRGAREVVAIDDFSDQVGLPKWETFNLCAGALGIKPEQAKPIEMSVYDVTEERLGRFDVVLCLGVLYHCRHPLLALEKLAAVCDGEIYVESAVCDDYSPYQGGLGHGHDQKFVAEFYPGDQYGENGTNWWVPTTNALAAMMLAAGFREVSTWKFTKPMDVAQCRGFAMAKAPARDAPGAPAPTPHDVDEIAVLDAVAVPAGGPIKLNLGCGAQPLRGYINLDAKLGSKVHPLPQFADNSVEEVRVSHVLEHFGYQQTVAVLKEWVRVLKPGGVMKIAVPDFDKIVTAYQNGAGDKLPLEGYLMGGQTDSYDIHLAMFNAQKLHDVMEQAGLTGFRKWTSEIQDCAALPVSLNIQGVKADPNQPPVQLVVAAMTVPRYGPTASQYTAAIALGPLGIKINRTGGPLWNQCFERCLETCVTQKADAILTLDYDSIFTQADVETLIRLLREHPDADAICSLQANRHTGMGLFTVRGPDGKYQDHIDLDLGQDLIKITTGHFGLTIIRVSSLLKMKHPWFIGQPAADGTWTAPYCVDDDITFWQQWEKIGNKAFLAQHVVIGHTDEFILWPGKDLKTTYQKATDYWVTGKPGEAFA